MADRSGAERPNGLTRARAYIVPAIAVVLATAARVGVVLPKWGVLGIFIGIAWVLWRLREQAAPLVAVFLSVLLIGVIFSPPYPKWLDEVIDTATGEQLAAGWAKSGGFDQELPIVLHLVFDEMMAAGAIPQEIPGAVELRESLYSLSDAFGMRLFDSVYARDFFSAISIPNVLNAEYRGRSATNEILLDQQSRVAENSYFDDLARRGYRTAVFQTTHMDFCANEQVALCETFDSYDPGIGREDGTDLRSRVIALLGTIIRVYEPSYTSSFASRVLYQASRIETGADVVLGIADRYDVQRFPHWFDRFSAFAASVPRGSHVFAHFLVPHAPYLLKEDCRVSGLYDGGYYLASRFPESEREAKRTEYYAAYMEQMHCVRSKIEQLLREVLARDAYKDAVIIIHGDHGSRISTGNVAEDLVDQDLIDNYGTFFAVRSPAVTPGIDCTFASLGEVFRRQFQPADGPPAQDHPLPVVITSRSGEADRVEVAMPKFGCAAAGVEPARPH